MKPMNFFCLYKKIHPVRIQRGKITSEVHSKKFPSRTKNNTQQVGRLTAGQRNLQTLKTCEPSSHVCGEGSSASVAKCRGSWVWVWVNVMGQGKVFQTK